MPSHDRSPGLRWPARQVNAVLDSLQLGRLLPAPRKRHQHGLQRRRAHERGLALSLRRDILSRLQKTLGRRNGALRARFPAVGASPVHPSRTKPVQTRRIRPYILASAPCATAWGPSGLPGLARP